MDDKVLIEVLFEQGLSLAQVSKLTGVSITALHGLYMHTKRKPRYCADLKTLAKAKKITPLLRGAEQSRTPEEAIKFFDLGAATK